MLPKKKKSLKSGKVKILFTGGGSGGHIYPIVAILRELKKMAPERFRFYFVGPRSQTAKLIFAKEGVKVYSTAGGKIRRYFSLKNFIDIFIKFPISFIQSFLYVFIVAPDITFSKGGYGAFPASLWSWFFQVPLLIQESDTVMGLTNKIMAHWAEEIFVSFPQTALRYTKKRIVSGNPVREDLLQPFNQEEAKIDLGLDSHKPTLLILGGSQGSKFLNNVILRSLSLLLDDFNIVHQTGARDFKNVKTISKVMADDPQLANYHPYPFLNEWTLKRAYNAADLVVSRAGAGSIFEIAALGKPSILVPLPEAVVGKHQLLNAYTFSQNGKRAVVIEEKNFTPHFFSQTVKRLFQQSYTLEEMGKQALSFAKPQAAKIISQYIIQYLQKP